MEIIGQIEVWIIGVTAVSLTAITCYQLVRHKLDRPPRRRRK
jgi:hypothetical protein